MHHHECDVDPDVQHTRVPKSLYLAHPIYRLLDRHHVHLELRIYSQKKYLGCSIT